MRLGSRGFLIIISGPAGAGKSTLAQRLCADLPRCVISISATTRQPRGAEVDGQDYFFQSRDAFEAGIASDAFAEYAEFSGNLYGTPRAFLDACLERGQNVVLDIEVKGASQLRRFYPESVKIFVLPPTPEVLVRRLLSRQTETREEADRRLHIARNEILRMEEYDYLVINDGLEEAFHMVKSIVMAEEHRMRGGECENWLGHREADDVLRVPE